MNPEIKPQTSIAKFEEFFVEQYKDKIFEILETYPDNRTLTVDYNTLEVFDQELADLLIDKPEEVIEAAKIAVKNIDPLAKDADLNIRFKNVTNIIPINLCNAIYVGDLIVLDEVNIEQVTEPKPVIDKAVFECRDCMRLHTVKQTHDETVLEPSLCYECGGRSFRLLQEESYYIDTQTLWVSDINLSKRTLPVVLYYDECSWDDYNIGDTLRITGILLTHNSKDGFKYYVKSNNVEHVTSNDFVVEEDIREYGERNNPEYNNWHDEVINRDKGVCQICGGNKHLHAHHIFSYNQHPDLRVNVDNGITLCQFCHNKYHSYYSKNATPQTLIKFIKRFRI